MSRASKYAPELRERAVRMVFDHAHEHLSQWATIRSVAEKIGCTVEALRRCVRRAERDMLLVRSHSAESVLAESSRGTEFRTRRC
jgi:transposase-like protein